MPQMAPLMWLPLMIIFSMLLISTMVMMFFYSPVNKPSSPNLNMSLVANTPNWSW